MIALIGAAALCALGQVDLRGGETAPAGVVVGVDPQGVLMAPNAAQDASILIGWDHVKRVGGVHGDEAKAYVGVADEAWRARTRLERGDAIAAEPMFEHLYQDYAGEVGPLSVVVSEGLLRCRLRRGAQLAAIGPWMSLLRARVDADPTSPAWVGDDWSAIAGMGPVLDESSWLVPALPPMWLAWPSLSSVAEMAEASDGRVSSLASLYAYGAAFEAGEAGAMPATSDQQWGVQLVRDIVEARTSDSAPARKQARERLSRRVEQGVDPWVEAWCRAGIGRSLVREESAEDRLLGVLELLHLPARFRRTQGYLAGLALGESVVVLSELGDEHSARALASELAREYRGHPVFDWAPLRAYLNAQGISLAPEGRERGPSDALAMRGPSSGAMHVCEQGVP